jgi:putative membrane protein insertion efficiency factor
MKRFASLLITGYQRFLSPLFPSCCRFYPTCSAYAKEAIARFGVLRGGYLALKRILRCNPLFRGGVDPVPETFSLFRAKKNGKAHGESREE